MRTLVAVLSVLAGTASAPADPPPQTTLIGSVFRYTVVPGDSLRALSARFGVETATLADSNGLSPTAILHPGQVVVVDNRHIALRDPGAALLLNIPQRMLYFDNGAEVMAYPVAVGKSAWPTPVGRFTVIDRERNPAWDVPLSIQAEMRRLGEVLRQLGAQQGGAPR